MHQCGLTNIDHRTKGEVTKVDRFNPTLAFADTGTMNKGLFQPKLPSDLTETETWKTKGGWLMTKKPNAREDEAKTFYMEKGKAPKV